MSKDDLARMVQDERMVGLVNFDWSGQALSGLHASGVFADPTQRELIINRLLDDSADKKGNSYVRIGVMLFKALLDVGDRKLALSIAKKSYDEMGKYTKQDHVRDDLLPIFVGSEFRKSELRKLLREPVLSGLN